LEAGVFDNAESLEGTTTNLNVDAPAGGGTIVQDEHGNTVGVQGGIGPGLGASKTETKGAKAGVKV
jgi:hypothetical protein